MATAGPNPKGELMTCLGCSRDTRNKLGYCSRCNGGAGSGGSGEQVGRSARSTQVLGGSPVDEDQDDEDADFRYHGSQVD